MSLDGRELSRRAREYCEANGLDSSKISIAFNAAGVAVGHTDVTDRPGWSCCCGVQGCDGGLAERGIDPASLTSFTAVIPLGGGS